jgi:FKBP-type peptidyl-prolyl cis-trans isomerase
MASNDKNITPYWLKWIVLAFILYAGYLHLTGKEPGSIGRDQSAATSGYVAPGAADLTSNSTPGVSVSNDIEGTGDPALCGQSAEVSVKGRRDDGQPLALAEGTQTMKVGVPSADRPWANGIAGMRPGGVREVALMGRAFSKDARTSLKLEESDAIRVMLTLEKLTPSIVPGQLAFLATDLKTGTGEVARCGRMAELHLTLWNPDGTVRYSSRDTGAALTKTVGDSREFYGLDRALINMRAGGVRRAIIPPAYLSASEDSTPQPAFNFPRDQVLIADVQLLNVTDPK